MQLKGLIGKQEVLVLTNYGSITSFIGDTVVQHLQLPVHPIASEHFTYANGGYISCSRWSRTYNGGPKDILLLKTLEF